MRKFLKYTVIIFLAATFLSIFAFNISDFNAYAIDENEFVYLGGNPIGIIANGDGLVVTEFVNVTTNDGCFSPAHKSGINKGDIIVKANDEDITDVSTLTSVIDNNEIVTLTILRKGKEIIIEVEPVWDLVQNCKKIGIMLKNNIAGIGTLTFVKENGTYGALGHQITDSFGNGDVYENGNVFECDITGYKIPSENTPGELLGKIISETPPIGTIEKNKYCGIFGHITDNAFYNQNEKILLGHNSEVKPGKAYIYTCIEGFLPEKYEIEIIKATHQKQPAEKSMVIRITDKRLLESTNGILQGMSGSPIIQNEKLIGAVTHVFTNDSTIGYGIYVDWMLNEA